MAEPAAQPNKRALLVGINAYPNLPHYSQLRGCVNDTQAMKHLLETSFDFPSANITILLNEEATEQGIRDAMEELIADCVEGDIVVFHFSGHGSQMPAKGDKPRGYDESIMPHDSGRMNPAFPRQVEPRDIRDTEINEWLSRLSQKTPHITLIFDSCHSGSITRLVSDSAEEGTRLRCIPPDPLPEGIVRPHGLTEGRGLAREISDSGWLPLSDKYVLLAACAAEQGAYEYDHEEDGVSLRYGAFTFFLTQEINQGSNQVNDKITYRDVWEKVSLKINNRFQKQTPQLEGASDKLIFNVQDFKPMRYLLVTKRLDGEAQLAGGAIHGLTVGSRWEIYPAGTKQITETKEECLGTVEITGVKSVTARAKIIEENFQQAIDRDARAVEVLHADPDTLMPVWIAPAPSGYEQAVEELQQKLAQSKLLEIKDSARDARAEVRIFFQNDLVAERGNSSHGPASAQARWSVLDHSQTLLMPQYEVAAPESAFKIMVNLEGIWRFEKVLELRNEKSALKGKVDFILLRKGINGSWQDVAVNEEPVYKAGDSIAFRVVNRSETSVFVSVLDLGLSKRINVLYPPSSDSEEIAVRRSGEGEAGAQTGGILSVGERAVDQIELYFPETQTFLNAAGEGESLRGKEFFKLVATTQRHNLNFLKQSGLRKEPLSVPEHPLERLIYLATTGGRKREAQIKLEPQDEWLTIERAFWLRRNE